MTALIYESTETSVPVDISVSELSLGGVTGLSPVWRFRRNPDGWYLDHNDGTFKSSGWTQKEKTLTENPAHNGFYSDILSAVGLGLQNGFIGIIEFENTGDEAFVSNDIVLIRNKGQGLPWIRRRRRT